MLKAINLKIEYAQLLFENVSFLLGNNEKVGLVGLNGSGKTTLLRILIGEEKPDSGEVITINEHIEYLPQILDFGNNEFVGEFLESLVTNVKSDMWLVYKQLFELGIDIKNGDIDEFQKLTDLSEGQMMKLYLTKILINNPSILLLDEPTNHLDIAGIVWFEEFINKFDGICIIISHDREFLNTTVNNIFELDEQKLNVFKGNYDQYLLAKENWIEKRMIEFKAHEQKRVKLEDRIKLIRKFSSGKKQSAMLSNAKKRLEREVTSTNIIKYKEVKISSINIAGQIHQKKMVLRIENLSFHYPNKEEILNNTSFEIYGREKIWFYGPNGIGKSTIVKLIIGQLTPVKGNIRIGENIRWEYFSQNQSHLPPDERVDEYFLRKTNISFNSSFGLLSRFLFSKDLQKYQIKDLSPGQRARLSFCIFAQHDYELLILDEPTNHLDIKTKEIIENALREFKGTILLISHDRYFVNSIGMDRVITLENKKIITVSD
ncbi:MAG: ABC-F family ATP-binding cassette domain-containing protein [bacterium]